MPLRIAITTVVLALFACAVLAAGDATVNISDTSKQPVKLVRMVKPVYPADAKEAGIEGAVRLHVNIGKDGKVEKVEVVEGHPKLAEASVEAVRQWVYEPVQMDGNAVEASADVTVNFALKK